MSNLICLECIVKDDCVDFVTGVLFQQVSFGWEEEEISVGETLFRVHCLEPIVIENISRILSETLPNIIIKKTYVPNQDWMFAWREFFTPVHVGMFTVIPPWFVENTTVRKHKIIIEPKSAFGTGHHATTVLCLEAISSLADKEILKPGMQFFDIGTGSGILSIACAKLGLAGLGVDIDPVAIANAQENILLNGVTDCVSIREGSVWGNKNIIFDVVIANILAEPLRVLANDIIGCLAPGGHLILSGILNTQAASVEAMYANLGSPSHYTFGEWVALVWNAPL